MKKEYGAIAQLGERLPCKQEVRGSTPLGSTIKERKGRRNDLLLRNEYVNIIFARLTKASEERSEEFFENWIVKPKE